MRGRNFLFPLLLLWVSALLTLPRFSEAAGVRTVCLVSPALPWTFGPYQSQMHTLSLLLHARGFKVYFMIHVKGNSMPAGLYRSWHEMQAVLPHVVPPPADYLGDHILGYIGNDVQEIFPDRPGDGKALYVSAMNAVAEKYGFDAYVTLSDIVHVIPDVSGTVPTVGWVPLHQRDVRPGEKEFFALRRFDALAILSPSSARAVRETLGERAVEVRHVPHVIDRKELELWAKRGRKEMARMASSSASDLIRSERFGETFNHRKEFRKAPHPIFTEAERDTFVVLMQGGNYDDQDRKGWDTSLQAFAKFYVQSYADGPPSRRIHLYIHSMESFLIQQDTNRGRAPPAALRPKGVNLLARLHDLRVPRSAFTLDIYQHEPEVVAAFKHRANVCLHPSKVEGFGMNLLECQALGTPVITTDYTATGDYSRLGTKVPHRQTIFIPGVTHDLALPDVKGVAQALVEHYANFLAKDRDPTAALAHTMAVEDARRWIDERFSPDLVGDAFADLLQAAEVEFHRRRRERERNIAQKPPTFKEQPMFHVAEGEYTPISAWEAPFTILTLPGLRVPTEVLQRFLWDALVTYGSDVMALTAKTLYEEDGTEVPFTDGPQLNDHFPVIVRTYLLSGIQAIYTRRVSIAQASLDHAMKHKAAKQVNDAVFVLNRDVALGRDPGLYDYYYGKYDRNGMDSDRSPPTRTVVKEEEEEDMAWTNGDAAIGRAQASAKLATVQATAHAPPSVKSDFAQTPPPTVSQSFRSDSGGSTGKSFRVFDDDGL